MVRSKLVTGDNATWAAVAATIIIPTIGWMFAVERRLGALGRVEHQLDKLVKYILPNEDQYED